jgi:hypothetical protein
MEDQSLFEELRTRVEREIDQYVYLYRVPEGCLGTPLSEEWISAALKEMREALINPYWTQVEFPVTPADVSLVQSKTRKCVAVADDGQGWLLLWDPVEEEFLLAWLSDTFLRTFGIRGDAVGCFLAR